MRIPLAVEFTSRDANSFVSGGIAWVGISVAIGEHKGQSAFAIDTGATVTVLRSADASRILGDAYDRMTTGQSVRQIQVRSLAGSISLSVQQVSLLFRSPDGDELTLELPILIEGSEAERHGLASGSRLPSLLGRDALRFFKLEISHGDPPTGMLETL